ncbi:hypothetical protein LTR65_009665 [Meristemomyces frigidus]
MSHTMQTQVYSCSHSSLLTSALDPQATAPTSHRLSVRNPDVEYVPIPCPSCRRNSSNRSLTFGATEQLSTVVQDAQYRRQAEQSQADRRKRGRENRSARIVGGVMYSACGTGPITYAPPLQEIASVLTERSGVTANALPVETAAAPTLRRLSRSGANALPNPPNTAVLDQDHGVLGAKSHEVAMPAEPKTPMTRGRPLPATRWAANKEALRRKVAQFTREVRVLFRRQDRSPFRLGTDVLPDRRDRL